ncbi:hypothetical protein Tco_0698086 [Tanacetum coccineum]
MQAVVSDSPVYKSCYEGDFSPLDEAIAADQRRLRIFLSQLKTSDVAFHVNKEVADLVWVVEKIKFIKDKVPEEEKAEDSLKWKKCSSEVMALIQELHVLVGSNGIGIDPFTVKLPYHILLEGSTQDFTYRGIAIGGDVFPGSTLSDHLMRFNNIPQQLRRLSDRVKPSSLPSWKLKEGFATCIILGGYLPLMMDNEGYQFSSVRPFGVKSIMEEKISLVYSQKHSWDVTFCFTTLLDQKKEKEQAIVLRVSSRSERECEVREYTVEEEWMLMESESWQICALNLEVALAQVVECTKICYIQSSPMYRYSVHQGCCQQQDSKDRNIDFLFSVDNTTTSAAESDDNKQGSDLLTIFTGHKDEQGKPFPDKFLCDICENFIQTARDTSSVALSQTSASSENIG